MVTDAHGSGNTESPDVIVEQMDKRATFSVPKRRVRSLSRGDGTIEKLASFTPYPVAPTYRFEISPQSVPQADLAGVIPGTVRLDSLTLGYTSPDFPEG